jgi:NADH-quinone oxidoreductase subunit L
MAPPRKAFTVTRVGDVLMAIGLFIIYRELGTLDIQELLVRARKSGTNGRYDGDAGGPDAAGRCRRQVGPAAAADLAGGCHGGPDAGFRADPRRHHGDGRCLPDCPHPCAVPAGAGSAASGGHGRRRYLVLAGFAALVQTDIKRILAYSTMSQIGYMFLALGVGAWSAAMFHLMTHAFFKALLFLSAGAVIIACHHEQNIFKMGGLRKKMPLVYACFLVGGRAGRPAVGDRRLLQ